MSVDEPNAPRFSTAIGRTENIKDEDQYVSIETATPATSHCPRISEVINRSGAYNYYIQKYIALPASLPSGLN